MQGAVTTTGLTIGDIPKASGSTSIVDSALSENSTTITSTKIISLPASTTSGPSLIIPDGAAPSSPAEGDIWSDGVDLNWFGDGFTRVILDTGNANFISRVSDNNTGASTAALITLFDVSVTGFPSNGMTGFSFQLQNLDLANSLNYTLTLTDVSGNVNVYASAVTLPHGQKFYWSLAAFTTATVASSATFALPIQEVKLQVIDTSPGVHASYSWLYVGG